LHRPGGSDDLRRRTPAGDLDGHGPFVDTRISGFGADHVGGSPFAEDRVDVETCLSELISLGQEL
jgi:hypothetical protein